MKIAGDMDRAGDMFAGYGEDAPDERPLAAYAGLATVFNAVRRTGRALPERIEARDLLLLRGGHAQDRAPRDQGSGHQPAARAVHAIPERGRGRRDQRVDAGAGLRHAVGKLLTCPFCFAVWATCLIASIFYMVTLSDVSQDLYDMLKHKDEASSPLAPASGTQAGQPARSGSVGE